ncbi:MAG: protein kinase [Myxococcales bacterium]|nr:protein kinase [Myxococcales bacterium]
MQSESEKRAVDSKTLQTGTIVADRYEVLELLGCGGMGEVYRVRDGISGASAALKRLRDVARAGHAGPALLFEREYHTLRQLAHPNIVSVYDYGVDRRGPYYTMELLDGEDLRSLSPLPWRQACAVLRDVASALAILHSRRLLHRDLSPRNVRRGDRGQTKLFDFGTLATMGTQGELLGTPAYMAPEIFDRAQLDARADLYSLGALAYFALSGNHAYSVAAMRGVREMRRTSPAPLSRHVDDIPSALEQLVLSLLSPEPLARPVSAGEVITRLTAIAGLEAVDSPEVARAYLCAPSLLGREQQLEQVREQIEYAGRGRGDVTLVEADAGMGRSRFLQAVELEAELAGATVLRSDGESCASVMLGVARALYNQLERVMPEAASEAAGAEAVAGATPEARAAAEDDAAEPKPPTEAAHAALPAAALCERLLEAASRRSLTLIVDDAELADEASLSVLAELARRAPTRRMVLVLSVLRDRSTPVGLDAIARNAHRLQLWPLDRAQSFQLVRSLFGDVPHATRVADWIYRLSEGSPRVSIELAQHLVERGIARYEQGAWLLPESLREHDLPTSLEQALAARLEALSAPAKRLAQGLASTTVALEPSEYALLLHEHDQRQSAALEAVDELVVAGVLVAQGSAFGFSQRGYADAARRLLPEEARSDVHRRLSQIAALRNDMIRQAMHLLEAGDEDAAVDTLMEHRAALGATLQFDGKEHKGAPQGPLPEDTTRAVRVCEHLLEVCERLGRPPAEAFAIRGALMISAYHHDFSLALPHARAQLAQLRQCSGAIYWERFANNASLDECAKRCVAEAQAVYDATPVAQRVISPQEALGELVVAVGQCQTLGRQGFEIELLRETLQLAEFFRPVLPRAAIVRDAAEHSLCLATGRLDAAETLRRSMIDYYDGLLKTGAPLHPISSLGRAIAMHLEGLHRACFGGDTAALWADKLERTNHEHGRAAAGPTEGHVGWRRAWEVRLLMHLYNGDIEGARRCQQQIDELSVRHAYTAYGTGTAFLEAQAHLMCGDVLGLKQSIETITQIVDRQYPGWQPALDTAWGGYHLLRGEPNMALARLDAALSETGAGQHMAWTVAAELAVEVRLALGDVPGAWERGRRALQQARAAELGFLAELGLERVLGLAEAAAGQLEVATYRLESRIEQARARGLSGVPLGVLLEAQARVALMAGDDEGFHRCARETAELYRRGGSPALVAKCERLLGEARRRGRLDSHAPAGAFVPTTRSRAVRSRAQILLEECESREQALDRALQVMLTRAGAAHGFLYRVCDDGGLALITSCSERPAPAELREGLRDFVAAIVDDVVEVTITCTVQDEEAGGPIRVVDYTPVLLSTPRDGSDRILGVIALHLPGDRVEVDSEITAVLAELLDETAAAESAAG